MSCFLPAFYFIGFGDYKVFGDLEREELFLERGLVIIKGILFGCGFLTRGCELFGEESN